MSREQAEQRIDTFERKHRRIMRQFASHAALSVVLDPALLHLLRVNYFLDPPDALPYQAEARLLLSPLCTEIDDGLYVIKPDERDVLLEGLVKDYGGARLRDVAYLLWEHCERGAQWLSRPGLAEAQQLTALNFIDPQRALAWLEEAERTKTRVGAITDERWFVAMRSDLSRRTTVVKDAEANPITAAGRLPALTELRDALLDLYGNPSAVDRLAAAAGLSLQSSLATDVPSQRWQQLVETAWAANRVPAVLDAAAQDHANSPALTRAIQQYWIRLSPALLVRNGHFDKPPPEWEILEAHRPAIERTMRSVCLFAQQEKSSVPYGMGFLIGPRTLLTHRSMAPWRPGREGQPPEAAPQLWLAFADRNEVVPPEFEKSEFSEASKRGNLIRVTVDSVREDPSGACAIRFTTEPESTASIPPPLAVETGSSDLTGRKVYIVGYPSLTDQRVDPTVVKQIMGTANVALRVQPGVIAEVAGPEGIEIRHNCFTIGGNGGSPLIDLATGRLLGLHYAGFYTPGPEGLKSGSALAVFQLLGRSFLDEPKPGENESSGGTPLARYLMPSLAELPDLTGFFSYSRTDDEHSQGSLSRLRAQIYNELRLQLGFNFKLWQDTVAIPEGSLWEGEIKRAISESVFFIPIVTPSWVASRYCRMEFEAFLDREQELGRKNLVFPLLYVRVPALEKEEQWRQDPLLGILGRRQYMDWQRFRHRSFTEAEIAEKIEQFCRNIVESLQQPWVSAAERRAAEEAEAKRIAEQARRDHEPAAPDIERIWGAVCAIQSRDGPRAHGFLIGPDLVLTTARAVSEHVLHNQISGLSCRFDGAEGPLVAFARDGVIAVSPPGTGDELLSAEHLDYALLRLQEPVDRNRRWLGISADRLLPPPGRPVRIPMLAPERLMLNGTTQESGPLALTVSYSKRLPPGLSGAPCLDEDLNVIAIMQASRFNPRRSVATEMQGIAIGPIARDLITRESRVATAGNKNSAPVDALIASGDYDQALKELMAEIDAITAAGNPGDKSIEYDLWTQVGEVRMAQLNWGEAERAFEKSRDIAAHLVQANDDPAWERNLALSSERIGDARFRRYVLGAALESFNTSLAVFERLQAQTRSLEWEGDIARLLDKIGRVYFAQADTESALDYFLRALNIRREAFIDHGDDATWQRDLAMSLSYVAGGYVAQHRLKQALPLFNEAVALLKKLVNDDPGNSAQQIRLAIVYQQAAETQVALHNYRAATGLFDEALEIRRRLIAIGPANDGWERDLAATCEAIGKIWLKHDDSGPRALTYLLQSLELREKLARDDPRDEGKQRDLKAINKLLRAEVDQGGRKKPPPRPKTKKTRSLKPTAKKKKSAIGKKKKKK
jgi:tetratricopeptide (TPR) repeat protein